MYKLTNFSFGFSDLLFNDVNLKIPFDEITVLTGANGAGKTTLLNILSGLNKNYSGYIKLENTELNNMTTVEISNKILYQKQEPIANIVATTPFEDLKIWLTKFATNTYNSNEIDGVLKRFGIYNLKDTPVWKLSGGQLKCVGLASLLLFQAKFWMLDEPLLGLDNTLQEQFVKMLINKKDLGRGALIVSHQIDLFKNIADKILVIKKKKV